MPPLPLRALATTHASPGTTTRSSGPCWPQTNFTSPASTQGGGGPGWGGWAEANDAGINAATAAVASSERIFMRRLSPRYGRPAMRSPVSTDRGGRRRFVLERHFRMHPEREQRADQQQAERRQKRQLPVAGPIHDIAERRG